MATPTIHTYHCICNSLLLATTHTLSSLPRRAPPSLDHAIILPLPPVPTSRLSSPSPTPESEPDEDNQDLEPTPPKPMPEERFTSLLSVIPDRRITLVRREDGFERRYLLRCGRCKLVVGYMLDDDHFGGSVEPAGSGAMDLDGDGAKDGKMKVVYMLPGGLMSTEVMAAGRKINEGDVGIAEGGNAVVAAWE